MKHLTTLLLTLLVLGGCAIPQKYIGETKDGMREGFGTYDTGMGLTYTGNWSKGKPVGDITMKWNDCESVYIGEVIDATLLINRIEVYRQHGSGSWINRDCPYDGKWKLIGKYENGEFKNGVLTDESNGWVYEGMFQLDREMVYFQQGTLYKPSGETLQLDKTGLTPLYKNRFYKAPITAEDLFKVAVGTVLVAGEIAASPAGQAAIANQEAKNQKAREEAIYKKGKRDGERRARKSIKKEPRLPQP